MKKYSLLNYFTIYSMIAFVLTGIILSILISNHIKDYKIGNTRDVALLTLDSVVKPALNAKDFHAILKEEKSYMLKERILNVQKNINISTVNILNAQGQIIFSTNPQKVGTFAASSEHLANVLLNEVDYSITNQYNNPKTRMLKSKPDTIIILSPILYSGKVVGAYEMSVPYKEIEMHIIQLDRIILLTIFSGLLVLFLLLLRVIRNASSTLIQQNQALALKSSELQESYNMLNKTYRNTIIALSNAVDARDRYTSGHSERVTKIALQIGNRLGLDDKRLQLLETAALFHDIGKVGISDDILYKAGKLTEEEYEIIKQHPRIGVNILGSIDFLQEALPIILHHHERFADGGYPSNISGEAIPLESRIIAIADTYDALTSDRPYRKGLPHNAAISEILKLKGIQFDENIVEVFISVVD